MFNHNQHHLALILFIFFSLAFSKDKMTFEKAQGKTHQRASIEGQVSFSIEDVYRTIVDFKNYPEFMPRFQSLVILDQSPNALTYKAHLNMPWPISDVKYHCRIDLDPQKHHIAFKLVEHPDTQGVKTFEGQWHLKKIDTHQTLLRYELEFVPLKKYPNWAIEIGLKNSLGRTIQAIRSRLSAKKT